MNQRLIAEIGRTQRLEIIKSLKRTRGMSVNELAGKRKLRYSGIKQQCVGPRMFECHSPILNLLDRYPIVGRLEQDMFEAVLRTKVRRQMMRNSGLYECAFHFAA